MAEQAKREITTEIVVERAEEMRTLSPQERSRRIAYATLEGKVIDRRAMFSAMQDGDCA